LDVELQASVEIYTREYEGLIQRKRELEEYLRSLQARLAEFGPSTNYFNEISVLRKKITHLEVEISTLKRTRINTQVKEKQIHVTYVADERAEAIRRQIMAMRDANAVLQQKIDFQNTRISHGGLNYVYEDTEVEGKKVRQVRKSNRNRQNAGVTISNAGDNNLVSQLVVPQE